MFMDAGALVICSALLNSIVSLKLLAAEGNVQRLP